MLQSSGGRHGALTPGLRAQGGKTPAASAAQRWESAPDEGTRGRVLPREGAGTLNACLSPIYPMRPPLRLGQGSRKQWLRCSPPTSGRLPGPLLPNPHRTPRRGRSAVYPLVLAVRGRPCAPTQLGDPAVGRRPASLLCPRLPGQSRRPSLRGAAPAPGSRAPQPASVCGASPSCLEQRQSRWSLISTFLLHPRGHRRSRSLLNPPMRLSRSKQTEVAQISVN